LQTIGLVVVLFALATPFGATLSNATTIAQYAPQMLAVSVGLLLHVSTTILFESSQNHQFNLIKLIFVIAGMTLAAWMSTSLNL
jgi:hypothetical protein